MSPDDVEIVRRWCQAAAGWFDAGRDPEGLARIAERYMAEEVVYEEDRVWPDAGEFRGRDAVNGRFLEYVELVHVRGVRAGRVIGGRELVLAEIEIEMLGQDAGEPIKFLWTYTLRVEHGRIAHFRAWYNARQGAAAAGIDEAAVPSEGQT